MDFTKVSFYVPVHGTFSQVEHTAPFLKLSRSSKIFIYDFNTEAEQMREFYRTSPQWAGCNLAVLPFTVPSVLEALRSEPAGQRVVVLLTASTNYGFGRGQRFALQSIAELFPHLVIDVFSAGHCMFGCESCGLSEHSVPIFFTRYARGELPYTAADLKRTLWSVGGAEVAKEASKRVLLCPTVGETSWICRPDIHSEVQELVKETEPKGVVFAAKFHGFCHLHDEGGAKPHVLFSLSQEDRAGVRFLSEVLGSAHVADPSMNCILPFFEAADIVITDVNSSVPFEALHSPHLIVIAFDNEETRRQDPEYVKLLNTFRTPEELRRLVIAAVSGDMSVVHTVGEKGLAFFQSKYGVVDGNEVARIAETRSWAEKAIKADAAPKPPTERTLAEEVDLVEKRFSELVPEQGPLDYLARGRGIPNDVAEYAVFEGANGEQLAGRGVPKQLWRKLFEKVTEERFDAGAHFSFARLVTEGSEDGDQGTMALVSASEEVDPMSDIWLIDHAWSTTLETSRQQLRELPGLIDRLEGLLGLHPAESDSADVRVNRAWEEMWKVNQHYRIAGPEGETSVLYVMDEVGTRVRHSPEPNVRVVPFVYAATGAAYSVMWPIATITEGELITRDFVEGATDPLVRSVKLLAYDDDVAESEPVDMDALAERLKNHDAAIAATVPPAPPMDPQSGLPNGEVLISRRPIRVFSDFALIPEYLKRPEFTHVENQSEADVIWLGSSEFVSFDQLRGTGKFVSQFPNEKVVCYKNLLARTVRKVFGRVAWLPETFDLTAELPEMVARFKEREEAHLDNHWIVKAFNLSRGQEITISKNLSCIIRQSDSIPKIACKYIERPCTMNGRKFDLRFLVYARSKEGWAMPEVFVYSTFWLRFANKQFTLDDLSDYETHFTVQNYRPGAHMTHMKDFEFIPAFEAEHGVKWAGVLRECQAVMGKVFQAASIAGLGIGQNTFSVYGIDMLLTHDFHPVLEEVNFSPDCTRACKYDSDFYNKTFGHFFLGEMGFVTRIL